MVDSEIKDFADKQKLGVIKTKQHKEFMKVADLIKCPNCGKEVKSNDCGFEWDKMGRKGRCPECKRKITAISWVKKN